MIEGEKLKIDAIAEEDEEGSNADSASTERGGGKSTTRGKKAKKGKSKKEGKTTRREKEEDGKNKASPTGDVPAAPSTAPPASQRGAKTPTKGKKDDKVADKSPALKATPPAHIVWEKEQPLKSPSAKSTPAKTPKGKAKA